MPINVKTAVYEGPLELLLELIEKRKLLVNDISLAQVADEYVAHVRSKPELPVGETAEFIALAATLLLIKSRSLLPTLTLSDEETRDIRELEHRLTVYQVFKEVSKTIGQTAVKAPYLYEGVPPEFEPLFMPASAMTPESLHSAVLGLIAAFPQHMTLPKVEVKAMVSIEEMLERLSERVSSAMRTTFREFTGSTRERGEIIVSFLALLELVKQGIIKAEQNEKHGDITLEADAVGVPTYD